MRLVAAVVAPSSFMRSEWIGVGGVVEDGSGSHPLGEARVQLAPRLRLGVALTVHAVGVTDRINLGDVVCIHHGRSPLSVSLLAANRCVCSAAEAGDHALTVVLRGGARLCVTPVDVDDTQWRRGVGRLLSRRTGAIF